MKFRQPAPSGAEIYHGGKMSIPAWDDVAVGQAFTTDEEWEEYLETPFQSVDEYVGALRRIAVEYPQSLHRKDSK
eukprot:8955020-Karenia_brevis.AAC.1